jgi:sugar phosphate isomerase/epimerase
LADCGHFTRRGKLVAARRPVGNEGGLRAAQATARPDPGRGIGDVNGIKAEGRAFMKDSSIDRRRFLSSAAATAGALALGARARAAQPSAGSGKPKYHVSLAAWSLHKMFFAGKVDQVGMVKMCRETFGIGGFEMVNVMFPSPTYHYCRDLRKTAEDLDVKLLLIMCDREGDMASPDRKDRMQASKNHHKWVDIAAALGCHAIRCNSGSGAKGDREAIQRAAESFTPLVEYGKANQIRIIIENHGGLSSDPASLVALMKAVDDPFFGTLPDFGNFPKEVDIYDAVRQMMPYARAVSAKCYDFDDETGLETRIDFPRMIKIVTDAGYNGWVGIEYEGNRLSEEAGIKAAKKLLDKLAV